MKDLKAVLDIELGGMRLGVSFTFCSHAAHLRPPKAHNVASLPGARMMNHARHTYLILLLAAAEQLHAATAIPAQGQSAAQVQADTAACQAQASAASTQVAPAQAAPSQGGRLRGAAKGAAAGAVAAEVRGNQHEAYDKIDSDVKQEYRQNQAKEAAAAGAVVGGMNQRQQRRQSRQQQEQAASQAPQQDESTFNSCMSAKGYTIQP